MSDDVDNSEGGQRRCRKTSGRAAGREAQEDDVGGGAGGGGWWWWWEWMLLLLQVKWDRRDFIRRGVVVRRNKRVVGTLLAN